MFAKSSTILYACPRSHLHHGPNIPDFLSRESLTALFLLWGGGGVALRSMRKKGVEREGNKEGGCDRSLCFHLHFTAPVTQASGGRRAERTLLHTAFDVCLGV